MQEDAVTVEKTDHAHAVCCDGGGGPLGHPKVYLSLEKGVAECPYCGRRFVAEGIPVEVGA